MKKGVRKESIKNQKKILYFLNTSLAIFLLFFLSFFFIYFPSTIDGLHTVTHSAGGTNISINEDSSVLINVTVTNTDTDASLNITQVNVTLPGSFSFSSSSEGTSAGSATFLEDSNTLSWSGDGLVMNSTTEYFWFEVTASDPGSYQLTVTLLNATGTDTTNLDLFVNDTTAPSLFYGLSNIANNSKLNRRWFLVNITSIDEVTPITSINFYVYNESHSQYTAGFAADFPPDTHLEFSTNQSIAQDGIFYFNATSADQAGNTNSTGTYIVTLDTLPPSSIEFVSPTPDNGSTIATSSVSVNVTAVDNVKINSLTVRLYDSTHTLVTSNTSSSSPLFTTFTGLSDGDYYINATVTDEVNQTNDSETRMFTVSIPEEEDDSSSSSGGGGGGGSSSGGSSSSFASSSDLEGGKETLVFENAKVILETPSSGSHTLSIKKIEKNSVTILIESDPIEATLVIGEEQKFDLDNDNVYDLSVILHAIEEIPGRIPAVNLTMTSISEPLSGVSEEVTKTTKEEITETKEDTSQEEETIETSSNANPNYTVLIIWVIVGVVILIIIYFWFIKKKDNSSF